MSTQKSFASIYFKLAFLTGLFVFSYVILIAETKKMTKEIIENKETLDQANNRLEELNVELQKAASADRIINYAETKLGLVKCENFVKEIKLNKIQLEEFNNYINKKYE